MFKYKISVVIPTYNSGDFIKEIFESIRFQTIGFEDIEVIFVDDDSTDSYTLELLEKLDDSYENVNSIFLSENSGFPGRGRNIGLDNAKGEFIIFADHDDTYIPDAFDTLYSKINENELDMAICNFNQVFIDNIKPFSSTIQENVEVGSFEENVDLFSLPAAIWTRLFRKEFLEKNNIRFLENSLCEDVYVATKATLMANGIIYLADFHGYNYKIRDSKTDKSTIHLRNYFYIESILKGYYEVSKMLEKEDSTKYGEIIFRKHLTSWIYTIVLSELTDNEKYNLFSESYELFNSYYTEDPYFRGKYNKIINNILNKEFKKAVKQSNKRSLFSKIKNKIKR